MITIKFVGILVCLYFLSLIFSSLRQTFALQYEPVVKRWQIYRLFTYAFFHGSFKHLFWNCIWLVFFGWTLEHHYLSNLRYIEFLVTVIGISGLLGLVQLKFRPADSIIGASGLLYGMIFALLVVAPTTYVFVSIIPVPVYIFAPIFIFVSLLYALFTHDRVAHGVHLTGAIAGVIVMVLLFGFSPWPSYRLLVNRWTGYYHVVNRLSHYASRKLPTIEKALQSNHQR